MTNSTSPGKPTALLLLGIVVIGSNSFVLSPILTDVAAALDTGTVVIARLISVHGAATAVSAFLFAGLVDRLGPRTILIATALVMMCALTGSALSPGWRTLGLFQAVAGLAAGIMLPAIYATATAAAPKGKEAQMLSRVLNGWALSLVAGVPLSAVLTQYLDWRVAYAALALLAGAAAAGFVSLDTTRRHLCVTPTVAPVRALRIPGVARLLGICLCFMTAFYGTYAFLGDHVRHTVEANATQAGMVVLAYGAGFGLAGVFGRRVDRIGPSRVFPVVLASVAGVYLLMPAATTSFAGALAIALVWGLANHFGLNILVLLLSARQPQARGAILGLHSTATYLSVFAGPMVFGLVYVRAGFGEMTLVASCLLGFATVLALGAKRRASADESQTRPDAAIPEPQPNARRAHSKPE